MDTAVKHTSSITSLSKRNTFERKDQFQGGRQRKRGEGGEQTARETEREKKRSRKETCSKLETQKANTAAKVCVFESESVAERHNESERAG